ncbi:hypothetical protein SEA_BEUFFERT_235 [Streptomyces phage Beuffert]|nr:hypothetical protein SEA_BEUFFERT_235 [Streptomyces phage Beuffert]
MSHGKHICKCGKVMMRCRCPKHDTILSVTPTCEHEWAVDIEEELDKEYDIAGYSGPTGKLLEVELPATRHTLYISLTNVYGFVITLNIGDETGGVLKEVDLYSCVKRENLADTIHSLYTSYE